MDRAVAQHLRPAAGRTMASGASGAARPVVVLDHGDVRSVVVSSLVNVAGWSTGLLWPTQNLRKAIRGPESREHANVTDQH
jgi:hypothetical protein